LFGQWQDLARVPAAGEAKGAEFVELSFAELMRVAEFVVY